MKWKLEGVQKLWDRYKFAALVVLIGAVLLLWPSGEDRTAGPSPAQTAQESGNIQAELEEILGTIQGVGEVRVMLTLDSDGERQLAFVVSGAIGMVQSWLTDGRKESPEDMAALAGLLILHGIQPRRER